MIYGLTREATIAHASTRFLQKSTFLSVFPFRKKIRTCMRGPFPYRFRSSVMSEGSTLSFGGYIEA